MRELSQAYGLGNGAVSEHFVEASRAKLKHLIERCPDETRRCALMVDATPFAGLQMVAALGIGVDGHQQSWASARTPPMQLR